MTQIAVAMLACAWIGYFVYCLREGRSASPNRRNATRHFSRSLSALGESIVGAGRVPLARQDRTPKPTVLLDKPRTAHEASRRRRQVLIGLVAAALASLIAAPYTGTVGWLIHLAVDVVLVCFLIVSMRRQHLSAEHEMRLLMLHGDRRAAQSRAMPRPQQGVRGSALPR